MLKNLVNGIQQTNIILIEDSLDYSGRSLWQAFVQQMSKSGQNTIHVLYYENPIEFIANSNSSSLQIHDCFSNPRGWINGDNEDCSLLEAVKKVVGRDSGDIMVAIDSLSPLLFNYGVTPCYRDLHTLVSRPISPGVNLKQLVCVVHEDFLPDRDSTILRLQHFATTYLKVEPPDKGNFGYPVVRITHKKPGGKIVKKLEQFYFSEEGHVISSDLQRSPEMPVPVIDPVTNMDELTTFRLGLRQEEIKARSQLVLPYLKSGETVDGGGGKVFYQPDAADDWDEEDPDDDLDV